MAENINATYSEEDISSKIENISIKTVDGRIIDGNAKLYKKNRVSELFTDINIYFIELEDTIDGYGNQKGKLFVNKDLVIWVSPRDKRNTSSKAYIDSTNYKNISLKTVEGLIIDGQVNLMHYGSLGELFYSSPMAPFVILKDAYDSNENYHHTLFINKKSIISIEEI